MLNWVPLGAACWIVTDHDGQAIAVAQLLLQLLFPHPRTAAIAAPTIRQDEQALRLRIGRLSLLFPPAGQCSHSKFWGIGGRSHIDSASIVRQIIDPVRNGFAQSFLREIMHIDIVWLLPPCLARILEVANQLLLLGINADDGPVGTLKAPFLRSTWLRLWWLSHA